MCKSISIGIDDKSANCPFFFSYLAWFNVVRVKQVTKKAIQIMSALDCILVQISSYWPLISYYIYLESFKVAKGGSNTVFLLLKLSIVGLPGNFGDPLAHCLLNLIIWFLTLAISRTKWLAYFHCLNVLSKPYCDCYFIHICIYGFFASVNSSNW